MLRRESSRYHRRVPDIETEAARIWPAAAAIIVTGVAYGLLPDRLREGPRWLLPSLVTLLVLSSAGTRWLGHHQVTPWIARTATGVMTAALVASVVLLVTTLPGSHTSGRELLVMAILLWAINLVVFALWYWEIDGGGPHSRRPATYRWPDFAFPQFQLDPENASSYWMPGFVDYLFLAFNTSTAFSPTDTMIMSKRAKGLMMSQGAIALVILAILAARAISLL
ncbi:MAG TPA: hypothetical protein VK821_14450 [Dehalococcoidia bacterium]|nr:hypothetical protein [Dehalococcoidia bacterium]